jgi:hypothetical protein
MMPTKQLTIDIPEPVLVRGVWSCNPECPLLVLGEVDGPSCCLAYANHTLRVVYMMTPGPECPQYQGSQGSQGSQGDQPCQKKT